MSVVCGTIGRVPEDVVVEQASPGLVSHTGVPLTRATTFRFTLDPTREQHRRLLSHAGAARLAFNHHLGRVKANLDQRAAERSYGVAESDLTPSALVVEGVVHQRDERLEGRPRRMPACCTTTTATRFGACRGGLRCPRTCSSARA